MGWNTWPLRVGFLDRMKAGEKTLALGLPWRPKAEIVRHPRPNTSGSPKKKPRFLRAGSGVG